MKTALDLFLNICREESAHCKLGVATEKGKGKLDTTTHVKLELSTQISSRIFHITYFLKNCHQFMATQQSFQGKRQTDAVCL